MATLSTSPKPQRIVARPQSPARSMESTGKESLKITVENGAPSCFVTGDGGSGLYGLLNARSPRDPLSCQASSPSSGGSPRQGHPQLCSFLKLITSERPRREILKQKSEHIAATKDTLNALGKIQQFVSSHSKEVVGFDHEEEQFNEDDLSSDDSVQVETAADKRERFTRKAASVWKKAAKSGGGRRKKWKFLTADKENESSKGNRKSSKENRSSNKENKINVQEKAQAPATSKTKGVGWKASHQIRKLERRETVEATVHHPASPKPYAGLTSLQLVETLQDISAQQQVKRALTKEDKEGEQLIKAAAAACEPVTSAAQEPTHKTESPRKQRRALSMAKIYQASTSSSSGMSTARMLKNKREQQAAEWEEEKKRIFQLLRGKDRKEYNQVDWDQIMQDAATAPATEASSNSSRRRRRKSVVFSSSGLASPFTRRHSRKGSIGGALSRRGSLPVLRTGRRDSVSSFMQPTAASSIRLQRRGSMPLNFGSERGEKRSPLQRKNSRSSVNGGHARKGSIGGRRGSLTPLTTGSGSPLVKREKAFSFNKIVGQLLTA